MAEAQIINTLRKASPEYLGKVLVLGLGKTGEAVCKYCLSQAGRVESLTVAAGANNEKTQKAAEELMAFAQEGATEVRAQEGATEVRATQERASEACSTQGLISPPLQVLFDEEVIAPDDRGKDCPYDLCIASPGISQFSDFYQRAAAHSRELIGEVEFAWRESSPESLWVAISGTNGKTTTTALCAHLCKQAGLNAAAVGNIGDTCIEAVAAGATDCYVAEVSSYQLASTKNFAPQVAVLLNITPDHIKWHRSFEAYCQAKQMVYANLAATCGVAVMDATNGIVREYVKAMKATPAETRGYSYIPLGTAQGITGNMTQACGAENAAWLAQEPATSAPEGMLCVTFDGTTQELIRAHELQIPGEHNIINALAAASAALALGCPAKSVREGLKTFKALEHRIEACGSVDGIDFYNDSKATNVDATLKALAAFGSKKPIVLLGGDDKGTSLDVLVEEAAKHCKAVVCYGEAGPRFYEAFEQAATGLPAYAAPHMREAFDLAVSLAKPEDIVVLSPACASFDEFTCFEERGEVFKELVKTLQSSGKAG